MFHIGNDTLKEILPAMSEHLKDDGELVLLEYTRKETEYAPNVIIRTADGFEKDFAESGFERVFIKPVIRMPSYSISLWKKLKKDWRFLLPFLYQVERMTIHRKPEHLQFCIGNQSI